MHLQSSLFDVLRFPLRRRRRRREGEKGGEREFSWEDEDFFLFLLFFFFFAVERFHSRCHSHQYSNSEIA